MFCAERLGRRLPQRQRQGEAAGHFDQRPLALGRVDVGQHGHRLGGELRVVERDQHRRLARGAGRRACSTTGSTRPAGRALRPPAAAAPRSRRTPRGANVANCSSCQRNACSSCGRANALASGSSRGEMLGLLEIARPGDQPHAERRRPRVVPQLLQEHADLRAGRSSRRSAPARSRAIARPASSSSLPLVTVSAWKPAAASMPASSRASSRFGPADQRAADAAAGREEAQRRRHVARAGERLGRLQPHDRLQGRHPQPAVGLLHGLDQRRRLGALYSTSSALPIWPSSRAAAAAAAGWPWAIA